MSVNKEVIRPLYINFRQSNKTKYKYSIRCAAVNSVTDNDNTSFIFAQFKATCGVQFGLRHNYVIEPGETQTLETNICDVRTYCGYFVRKIEISGYGRLNKSAMIVNSDMYSDSISTDYIELQKHVLNECLRSQWTLAPVSGQYAVSGVYIEIHNKTKVPLHLGVGVPYFTMFIRKYVDRVFNERRAISNLKSQHRSVAMAKAAEEKKIAEIIKQQQLMQRHVLRQDQIRCVGGGATKRKMTTLYARKMKKELDKKVCIMFALPCTTHTEYYESILNGAIPMEEAGVDEEEEEEAEEKVRVGEEEEEDGFKDWLNNILKEVDII